MFYKDIPKQKYLFHLILLVHWLIYGYEYKDDLKKGGHFKINVSRDVVCGRGGRKGGLGDMEMVSVACSPFITRIRC